MINDIKFIKNINSRKVFCINGITLDFIKIKDEIEAKKAIELINKILEDKINLKQYSLEISVRDFMLIGYFFYNKKLEDYLIYYIQILILESNKKSISKLLVLKNVFNLKYVTEAQYTIHESTEVLKLGYNEKIKQFVKECVYKSKIELIRQLLINNDKETLSENIKKLSFNTFLEICSTHCKDEAMQYFSFIIKEILIPNNEILSLNRVIGTSVGMNHIEAKSAKNRNVSKEKLELYEDINRIIEKNNNYFSLSEKEIALLESIEYALDNNLQLNSNKLCEIEPNRMLKICFNMFRNKFLEYLNNIKYSLKKNNIIITRIKLIQCIFSNTDEVKANHIYTYYKMNNSDDILENFIVEVFKEQVKEQDKVIIDLNKDIWVVRWVIKESYKTIKFDFSNINNSLIKIELKKYYKFIIEREFKYKSDKSTPISRVTNRTLVIYSVKYMQNELKLNSFKDINRIHIYRLIKHLKDEYRTNSNKKLKVSSIVQCIGLLKSVLSWLIDSNLDNRYKELNNPFDYVMFKGVDSKNTDIIPECVIEKILFHLNELRDDIQRMTLIMLNCGMRFKEVAYLDENCLDESSGEINILKYVPYKVLEARRRNGLEDYHRIVIDKEIYNEINKQIESTKYLREKYNTSEIFLNIGINNNLKIISNHNFVYHIQCLINKYNITDESGNLWKITSKQYRKTLAVDMITKGGATADEVGNYLGHLNRRTTEKFYAEVRKMKLAEMNSEFFKKRFDLLLEDKELERFSEEERKKLYVDFCLNSREVEFGVCTANFNVDSCNKRGDRFSCATCAKICTGKKYHKRWCDLYISQENIVNKLIDFYEKNNVDKQEYETFREYEKEKFLLDSFKTVVEKLQGDN